MTGMGKAGGHQRHRLASQRTMRSVVLIVALITQGPVALGGADPRHDASELVSRMIDLVATQKIDDRTAVEQALEIEITKGTRQEMGDWRIVGWLAPPGELADAAYHVAKEKFLPTAHGNRSEVGSIWVWLESAPCVAMDTLRDAFHRDGWMFKTEERTPVATVLTTKGVVDQYGPPLLVAIGELGNTGMAEFRFPNGASSCARDARAAQYF
jgi:hypothetical protein